MTHVRRWIVLGLVTAIAACSTAPTRKPARPRPDVSLSRIQASGDGREIVMYSLGLLGVGYQFGGSNPDAGLDCSGMAAFIYKNAVGVTLPHNAAEIASRTREIDRGALKAGDLVFFNTMNRRYSHMGIYIGDNKFVHAPRTNSVIRVDSLDNSYFAARYDGARAVLN
ncbi:cell wall-associated NlpC family hydrolase [Microvirgula sp. AG722]|uniref:C40 family peptidase n=1 Tax=Microvirgula sp. AG722 TaxID=2183901 RepID=UPI000DC4FA14|nr:C40 family peptidase [Microvirgula sp. AG722]RAS15031.1 cell wall-associated NlpC family hydrolase [Microvirgula sp. AG722]